MANPTLDLNAATHHEEEPNPTKTLDPSDSPPAKPDLAKQPKSPSSTDENGSKKEGEVKKPTLAKAASPDTGAVNDIQKKMKRAERFGMPVQLTEEEKRNSRAERFGTGSTVRSSDASKQMEEQKRKARAERFGLAVPSAPSDEEARKKARLERFGSSSKLDPSEEEKRKARAIRFANASTTSAAPVIGKGSDEPNTAVVGKAGGTA